MHTTPKPVKTPPSIHLSIASRNMRAATKQLLGFHSLKTPKETFEALHQKDIEAMAKQVRKSGHCTNNGRAYQLALTQLCEEANPEKYAELARQAVDVAQYKVSPILQSAHLLPETKMTI